VPHPHKTTDKVTVLYILTFKFLDIPHKYSNCCCTEFQWLSADRPSWSNRPPAPLRGESSSEEIAICSADKTVVFMQLECSSP